MSIHVDEPEFDRTTPVPLYHQLKQWIAGRIASGALAPGAQLPGELELCERFGLSRGVVRQALSELRYEGLLERQRGRGTYVSVPKTAEGLISGLRGLADDAALRGQQIDSKVLLLREIPAGGTVARSLQLAPGETIVELERIRALDGEPHVLVMTYLPAAMVPGLVHKDMNGHESLYRILREEYGLAIVSSVRRVEATLAGAREARLLGIDRGDPLLVLRSVGFTTGHRPFDYFIAYHRGDRSAFEAELSGSRPTTSGPLTRRVLPSSAARARSAPSSGSMSEPKA